MCALRRKAEKDLLRQVRERESEKKKVLTAAKCYLEIRRTLKASPFHEKQTGSCWFLFRDVVFENIDVAGLSMFMLAKPRWRLAYE